MNRRINAGLVALAAALMLDGSVYVSEMLAAPPPIDPALLNKCASAKAPQGIYHRNIGYLSAESPVSGSQTVEVDGRTYFYDQGMFWVQQGSRFMVVAAPVGAIVNALPGGTEAVPGGKGAISYWFGTFFGEKEGKYEVLPPPVGAVVGYLPDGYEQEIVDDTAMCLREARCFKPVLVQGTVMYQVADCSKNQQAVADARARREETARIKGRQSSGPVDRAARVRDAQAAADAAYEKELRESEEFLWQMKKNEPDAREFSSGLVYIPIVKGAGESPDATSLVTVKYKGMLRDGSVFDSSIDRGQTTFPLNRVIACWAEGIQEMKVGGEARLVCPSTLAYGRSGSPPKIPPGAVLVFEVTLLAFEAAGP